MHEILWNLFKSSKSTFGFMKLIMHLFRMILKKEIIIVCSGNNTNM